MRTRSCVAVVACAVLFSLASVSTSAASAAGDSEMKYNKSWIGLRYDTLTGPIYEGDKLKLIVDYYLDPSEHQEPTVLVVYFLGPRAPGRPRPGERRSRHTTYGGQRFVAQPGRHREVLTFTVPEPYDQNYVLFVGSFEGWPWNVRAKGWWQRRGGYFELETDKPGNLFTYEEPVTIEARLKCRAAKGERKTLTYMVDGPNGERVAEGSVDFVTQGTNDQTVAVPLQIDRRGVFTITAEVPGWETRTTSFGRIPDLMAITGGRRTRFGMTTHAAPWLGVRTEEVFQIARRLGLTACRAFTRWDEIEPGPGVYQLENWDHFIEMAHKHGVDMIILPWGPPAWVLPEGREYGYNAFECDWDAWEDMVRTVTTRWNGKFYAWEWLNEINPGGSPNYPDDYLNLCRIGTTTARSIYPGVKTMLAGGLYPRSFRLQMLRMGVGRYIDILPVHYQNGDGVREARQDLDNAGLQHVEVWEDETRVNADWLMMQWTDELAAGCKRIIAFAGEGSTGSGGYIRADNSPTPSAATIAVFTSKMFEAEPVGIFLLGKGGLFHLFERNGEPVLVASTYEETPEEVDLWVGTDSVRITDDQGNETGLNAEDGRVRLPLSGERFFLEDADLDILKAYAVATVETARVGSGTSVNVARAQRVIPRASMVKGKKGDLSVRLRNHYDRVLEGSFEVSLPSDWPQLDRVRFALEPGADLVVPVRVSVPADAEDRDYSIEMEFDFAWGKLPNITKPAVLTVVSPDAVGNLLLNGGFERLTQDGDRPEGWNVNTGGDKAMVDSDGLGDGLGKHVVKLSGTENYESISQSIPIRGGQTYLYTAWVWNRNMPAGSNMTLSLGDGTQLRYYTTQVFSCGTDSPYWQMYVCRREVPPTAERMSIAPLAIGGGWTLFDNVRVTLYEGTDYAAECHRTRRTVTIDGDLDEWVTRCPIPLMGKNQLTVVDEDYEWSPENLGGVGYLMWDDANLYVAVKVRDNVHRAVGGADVTRGDGLILAFDPTKGRADSAEKSFAFYISSATPGGGSGFHTVYRPAEHSGGLQSGQLFKDSSIYEVAVKPEKGVCVYEMRIPFSELGGITPEVAGKFAFSAQLNDSDGDGPAAHMNWGDGLTPAWSPEAFGVVTMVE